MASSLNIVLDNRTVSSFPLSVPTGIAFESLFQPTIARYDPKRVVPNIVKVHEYQHIYINLWTLFRNMISSIQEVKMGSITHKEIVPVLEIEMETIDSLFQNEGGSICKPIYYFCTYDQLYTGWKSKDIKMRQDRTPAQMWMRTLMMQTMKDLVRNHPTILQLDCEIEGKKSTSLIMTHVPYDLTSYNTFSKLDLLESHTGVLKSKALWSSKYYPIPDADMSFLPWHKKLLFIFGDKVLIQPLDIKLRRQILDTARARNWNQSTTLEKIMMGIELDIREPFVVKYLRGL